MTAVKTYTGTQTQNSTGSGSGEANATITTTHDVSAMPIEVDLSRRRAKDLVITYRASRPGAATSSETVASTEAGRLEAISLRA